jgi:hypothetical protein
LRPAGRVAVSLADGPTVSFCCSSETARGQGSGEFCWLSGERWRSLVKSVVVVVVKVRKEDAVADRLAGGALAVAAELSS